MFPRSSQKEIMDDVLINDERLDEALRDLSMINRWLGGLRTSRKGVRTLLAGNHAGKTVSVLDVGAGGSDFVSAVRGLTNTFHITSFDVNSRACEYSKNKFPFISVVQGSVLDLPFKVNAFDIVHASLFFHHFSEEELRPILISLYKTACSGIVINDLRRSIFSYYAIMVLTRLFFRSPMVINDAPISVRRGFTRQELVRLCSALPPATVTIRRTWAFRWLVCIMKPQ